MKDLIKIALENKSVLHVSKDLHEIPRVSKDQWTKQMEKTIFFLVASE